MAKLIEISSNAKGTVARVEFDKVRKLKATHGALADILATAQSQLGRSVSVQELAMDLFVGNRYLVFALLIPDLQSNEKLTLSKVSRYIDQFYEKGGKPEELQDAIATVLSDYLQIEKKPTEDESDIPNAPAPIASGSSDGA